jgi:hypothetical protein
MGAGCPERRCRAEEDIRRALKYASWTASEQTLACEGA